MNKIKMDAVTKHLPHMLTSIQSVVEEQYPTPAYANFMPIDSSDPEGANHVGYRQFTRVGMSKVLAAGAKDSPSVGMFAEEVVIPVKMIGNHWDIDFTEVQADAMANTKGTPIPDSMTEKPKIAALATEQHLDEIAMLGDGTKDDRFGGCYGIVYHPNTTKIAAPKTFASSTNDEIIAEFSKIHRRISKDTLETYRPNTFALSADTVAFLNGRRLEYTNQTLLSFLKDTYPDMAWKTHARLDTLTKNPATLATEDNNVILCYYNSPLVLSLKVPMPSRDLPEVWTGQGWTVERRAKTAGVQLKQPLCVVCYYGF